MVCSGLLIAFGRHRGWLDKAHGSVPPFSQVSLAGDLPSVSLGLVQVLVAQLPTRGIPRFSRSRTSLRLALCVQGLGGTASERITDVSLHSIRARHFLNGTRLGHPGYGAGVRGGPAYGVQWLVEAAEQLQAFSRHVLHDVRVRQVQLDELFALLSAVKAGEVSQTEALERLERTPQWVWV